MEVGMCTQKKMIALHVNCDLLVSLDKNRFYHTDEQKQSMSEKMSGTVVVKNTTGDMFRVSIDDPRYKSGELIPAICGKKKPTKQCEWCSKVISTTNHTRWYGNNCKQKENRKQ